MSANGVSNQIERIKAAVTAAYTSLSGKGATLPEQQNVDNISGAIDSIVLGVILPTLTAPAAAGDILSGKQAIDSEGEIINGTIASRSSADLTVSGAAVGVPAGYYPIAASKSVSEAAQATPSITVSSTGLITASTAQTAGYVAAGTKSTTKQLTTKGAATITPGTSNQTIAAGVYLTGAQTIQGDANLAAGNIKSGVSIFGKTGTYTGEGLQYATGSFTQTADSYGGVTVSGLSFKPQLVFFSTSSTSGGVTNKKYIVGQLVFYDVSGIAVRQFGFGFTQTSSGKTYATASRSIDLRDDGFFIDATTYSAGPLWCGGTYNYLAIG